MVNYWDKYTEMHGQQNDKYTAMHGQQNDKYTEMHCQQNLTICDTIDVQTLGCLLAPQWTCHAPIFKVLSLHYFLETTSKS